MRFERRAIVVSAVAAVLLAAAIVIVLAARDRPRPSPVAAVPTERAVSPSPTAATLRATPPAVATTTAPAKPRSRVVRWIKAMGITGGADGESNTAAYDRLSHGSCDGVFTVEPESFVDGMRPLYHGAAWACQAAFDGRRDGWAKAEAAYRAMASRSGDFGCLEVVTYRMLGTLVEAHRGDPGVRFVRGSGSPDTPDCPRLRSIQPDHGPVEGGFPVRLTGENLPARVTVVWNDTIIRADTDGRTATITAPPGEPGGAYVFPRGWPYGKDGAVWFTYEQPPSPSASGD